MRKIILLFFSTLIFSSCIPSKKNTVSFTDECKFVEKVIEKDWKKAENENYFIRNDDFLLRLQKDYRNCIIGLSRNDIITLFGKPFEENDLEISYYFLDKGCMEVLPKNCEMLIFYHDKSEQRKVIGYDIQKHVYHD
jgi:hypothetical protein